MVSRARDPIMYLEANASRVKAGRQQGENILTELYHYTDAGGLLGIIENKCIWATDCRFLNDETEFDYGMSVFKSMLPLHEESLGKYKELFLGLVFDIENKRQKPQSPYVCSFTKEGDLLSQWRGYNGGVGYSIGFNQEVLKRLLSAYALEEVTYDELDQKKKFEQIFQYVHQQTLAHPMAKAGATLNPLSTYQTAILCKHASFSEEKEVRLTLYAHQAEMLGVRYRTTPSGLRPYCRIPLVERESGNIPGNLITAIKIGPGLHDIQLGAVRMFLEKNKLSARVEKSKIPFRMW